MPTCLKNNFITCKQLLWTNVDWQEPVERFPGLVRFLWSNYWVQSLAHMDIFCNNSVDIHVTGPMCKNIRPIFKFNFAPLLVCLVLAEAQTWFFTERKRLISRGPILSTTNFFMWVTTLNTSRIKNYELRQIYIAYAIKLRT